MAQSGQEDAAGLLVLLVAVHLIGVALVPAVQRVGQHLAQREVQQHAAYDGKNDLADDQQDQGGPLARLSGQQRNGLVAGGDKYGQQCAGGDDPAGVKVGC